MRENRTYGSQGGEAKAFPTPIGRVSQATMASTCRSAPTRWQLALVPPCAGASRGAVVRQLATATVQRGLKAQPSGMAPRRGIAPSIWLSVSARWRMLGIEAISPEV